MRLVYLRLCIIFLGSMEAVRVHRVSLESTAMKNARFGNMERPVNDTVHANEIFQVTAAI